MRRIVIVLALVVLAALFATGCESSGVGSIAPDFKLQSLDGESVSLSDYSGTPVLINFWATWCGYCREEMPYLQQIDEEWPDSELVVLTVDVRESASRVERFMQTYNLSLTVLLDSDGSVAQEYNLIGYPTTFFIDKDGIIREKASGAFRDKSSIEYYLKEIIPYLE
ncbi:TlpA family protein disulfide reductase [Chloroflexota bacterium]